METMARLLIVLGLGCLLLMGVAGAQSRTSVQIPQSAKGASYVGLELSLRSVRKQPDSNVAAVVRLRGQEVGRISLVAGGDQRFGAGAVDEFEGTRHVAGRGSGLRPYVNTFATLFILGVWHGANWTFVVYGLIHGAAVSVNRATREDWLPEHETPA